MTEDRRVGTIQGDRLCAGCGFNLIGQPIMREARYDLLIARCPECGAVASLQEYPVLGRWANRWAALLGAAWLLAMLLLLLGPSGLLYASILGISRSASLEMGEVIGDRYLHYVVDRIEQGAPARGQIESQWFNWLQQTERAIQGIAAGSNAPLPTSISQEAIEQAAANLRYWASIDPAWWAMQDQRAIRAEAGGLRVALASVGLGAWFWLVVLTAFYGMVLSVALIHRRRRAVLVAALLPIVLAAVVSVVFQSPDLTYAAMNGMQARELARQSMALPIVGGTVAIAYACIAAGVVFGRPLARLALRALLPPRLCGALAYLWTAEGRDPPRPVRGAARP